MSNLVRACLGLSLIATVDAMPWKPKTFLPKTSSSSSTVLHDQKRILLYFSTLAFIKEFYPQLLLPQDLSEKSSFLAIWKNQLFHHPQTHSFWVGNGLDLSKDYRAVAKNTTKQLLTLIQALKKIENFADFLKEKEQRIVCLVSIALEEELKDPTLSGLVDKKAYVQRIQDIHSLFSTIKAQGAFHEEEMEREMEGLCKRCDSYLSHLVEKHCAEYQRQTTELVENFVQRWSKGTPLERSLAQDQGAEILDKVHSFFKKRLQKKAEDMLSEGPQIYLPPPEAGA